MTVRKCQNEWNEVRIYVPDAWTGLIIGLIAQQNRKINNIWMNSFDAVVLEAIPCDSAHLWSAM